MEALSDMRNKRETRDKRDMNPMGSKIRESIIFPHPSVPPAPESLFQKKINFLHIYDILTITKR